MTVESELGKALSITAQKNGDRQAYLAKFVAGVQNMSDKGWEGLSPEAQKWCNDASSASDASEPLPDFVEGKKPAAGAKPAKAAAGAKAEKAPAEAKVRKTGNSAYVVIKQMIIKNPEISVAKLSEQLEAKELKAAPSTITTVRADMRHTLRMLQDAGKLSEDMIAEKSAAA